MTSRPRTDLSISALRTIALSVLCALSTIAITLALFWYLNPEAIDSLAAKNIANQRSEIESELREAQALLRIQTDSGRAALLELLLDLESVGPRDKESTFKIRIYNLLTLSALKEGDLDRGAQWTRDWIEFNPRDINAKLRLASLYAQSPETMEQLQLISEELYSLLPENQEVAHFHALSLLSANDLLGFWRVQIQNEDYQASHLDEIVNSEWQIFWDFGSGFSSKKSKRLKAVFSEDNQVSLNFDLPESVRRIRIDPPTSSGYVLRNIEMSVISPDKQGTEYQLSDPNFSARNATNRQDDLYIGMPTGLSAPIPIDIEGTRWESAVEFYGPSRDPYFWWTVESTSENTKVHFEASVVPMSRFLLEEYFTRGGSRPLYLRLQQPKEKKPEQTDSSKPAFPISTARILFGEKGK